MQVGNFPKAFDAVKATLKSIDDLTQQAGQHFNEAQADRAKELAAQLKDQAAEAADAAEKAIQPEPEVETVATFGSDVQGVELEEDDVVETVDGHKFYVKDGKLVPVPAQVIGQSSDIQGSNLHPVTQAAMGSIQTGIDKASHGVGHGNPGVITKTASVADKGAEKGDALTLATSEGDVQTAHSDDGSRTIQDGDASEAVKLLTPDVPLQGGLDGGTNNPSAAEESLGGLTDNPHKFIPSITADAPADAAAVLSGKQEVVRPTDGTPTPDPTTASSVTVHPVSADPVQEIANDAAQDAADVTGDTAEVTVETKEA